MECWSKSGDPVAPARVEELLEQAFRDYSESGDKELMPNLRTFTMAILTFSKNNGQFQKARDLLTQLISLYAETQDPDLLPNAYPFNYVLDCAANSYEDKTAAFHCATQTYQEMRRSKYVAPDSFTYNFWLKCCSNLLPESDMRSKCVKYAMEECKQAGHLSQPVLNRLLRGSNPGLVSQILELDLTPSSLRSLRVEDLNPRWSRSAA